MAVERKFTGTTGRTLKDTRFAFDIKQTLPADAPNVIYIVLDDLGFAHLGCYGSDIRTPNIDALASDGLRYNNFHTTAVCSATRASLLTGANHHAAGCSTVIEQMTGAPNAGGSIHPEYATAAEILHEYGYATFASGKWHLSAFQTQAGPYDSWPLQKGFDRFYGFLQAENNQYHPQLVRDNYLLSPEEEALRTDQPGYHFSKDIVDNAIENIFTHINAFPDQPFFLYLTFGAQHTPHHAPKEYIDRYKGAFDEGWDAKREKWFARQKEIGIVPENAELTKRNEYVDAWDDLSADQKKAYARLMESYAGMLEYTDEQTGRLIDYLKETGIYDNTLIVLLSDNGASAEGGKDGRHNFFDGHDIFGNDDGVEEILKHYNEIGSEETAPHYPTGWANAGNTPFQWYKIWAYEGGVKDPLIITYPKRIKDKGGIRGQYHHVSDITPTVLDVIGTEKPGHIKGVAQKDFTGISLAYTFDDAAAPDRKHVQYYEIFGNRGIYKDGWKAVANHAFSTPFDYDHDEWELYHVEEDYSEKYNVADKYLQKLRELQDEFLIEAAKNDVFPMMGKSFHTLKENLGEAMYGRVYIPETKRCFKGIFRPYDISESNGLRLDNASYRFEADIERESAGVEGVIFSSGDMYAGYTFYIKDNVLKFVYNQAQRNYYTAEYKNLPEERITAAYDLIYINGGADITLFVNGKEAGSVHVPKVNASRGYCTTIRANKYTPISPEYEVPFEFGGKIYSASFHQAPSVIKQEDEIKQILHHD